MKKIFKIRYLFVSVICLLVICGITLPTSALSYYTNSINFESYQNYTIYAFSRKEGDPTALNVLGTSLFGTPLACYGKFSCNCSHQRGGGSRPLEGGETYYPPDYKLHIMATPSSPNFYDLGYYQTVAERYPRIYFVIPFLYNAPNGYERFISSSLDIKVSTPTYNGSLLNRPFNVNVVSFVFGDYYSFGADSTSQNLYYSQKAMNYYLGDDTFADSSLKRSLSYSSQKWSTPTIELPYLERAWGENIPQCCFLIVQLQANALTFGSFNDNIKFDIDVDVLYNSFQTLEPLTNNSHKIIDPIDDIEYMVDSAVRQYSNTLNQGVLAFRGGLSAVSYAISDIFSSISFIPFIFAIVVIFCLFLVIL